MLSKGGNGSSKSKIRPPRRGLISPSNDLNFDETWKVISSALKEMHTKNASGLSFEQIYRHAYKVVLKKMGDAFYDRLQQFEHQWLSDTVHRELASSLSESIKRPRQFDGLSTTANERRAAGEHFLKALKESFEDHQLVMNMATDVFMYLDRVFCNDTRKPSIYTSGMMQFRDCILRLQLTDSPTNMQSILVEVILEQIAMERDGDPVDRNLIKSCVNVLEGLHESAAENEDERLYLTCFEPRFLDASRDFYRAEGTKLLQDADAAQYCRHALGRIKEESQRCNTTLSESTKTKIVAVVDDELIRHKIHELILTASGVKHMVDNDRFAELRLLYELNSRVDPKKSEITKAIQRGVQDVGGQINDAAANAAQSQPPQTNPAEGGSAEGKARAGGDRAASLQTAAAIQWVEAVLRLKDKYDQIWKDSLDSDPAIRPALERSFTESINLFLRCSEFISLFIDENMKKGLKDKSEAEVDVVLDKAIVLLRYIQDKDMFERYYKKHLCKRLLMNKSLSIDNEQEMIRKMKVELGNSFVSKLEAMFKDMQLSEELSAGFRARVADSGAAAGGRRADLSIHVLTSMTWPLETMNSSTSGDEDATSCIYPREVREVQQNFEAFYGSKHSGRQLTWMANMGTADVRAYFPAIPGAEGATSRDRRYELNVSTYAMVILLLFNDLPAESSISFDEIQTRTNIPTNDLIRNLQSLAVAPRTRVLIKQPMSKDVKSTDRFSYNDKFAGQYLKIKVGVVAAAANNKVEGEKERRETERKNNESRGYAIEAAIVRIMKQRKELAHQQLVAETLTQLSSRFQPDVGMIKRKIEALIEREYLERIEESQPPSYRYLA